MTEPSLTEDAVRRRARRLAAEAITADDPTGWFETLYGEAERGDAAVPWADQRPCPHLVQWAGRNRLSTGRALVVGCGWGDDAEYLCETGLDVTAFDISPTAIRAARRRFPGSAVTYQAADLRQPPAQWAGAFDLVVEIYTIQALYGRTRAEAIAALPRLVAPGGTLLVIARATREDEPVRDPSQMPWPLTRAELDAMAGQHLSPADVQLFLDGEDPPKLRWRAEFRRR